MKRYFACSIGVALVTLVVATTASAAGSRNSAKTGRVQTPAAEAIKAYEVLSKNFFAGNGLVRASLSNNTLAEAWPFSHVMEASVLVASLPHAPKSVRPKLKAEIKALRYYLDTKVSYPAYMAVIGAPYGPGFYRFYDDNAWIGQALVQAYHLTHNGAWLTKAERLFVFIRHGWDYNRSYRHSGGVFWTTDPSNHDRNTVSTAAGAQLALELYQISHRTDYLDWAKTMYVWVNATLLSANGLFNDHIGKGGGINRAQWSYNQGLMLGDATLLYEITKSPEYLAAAQHIAKTALGFYGSHGGFAGQPIRFNSKFFENLALLDAVAPSAEYATALKSYITYLKRQINPKSEFLSRHVASAINQASVVELLCSLNKLERVGS